MAILTMEEKLNVVIVGSGPAGLCAALWFTRLGIDFIVLEQRAEPLDFGRADGVQCRTVEVFESFGLAEELVRDAYWVNEVCFWAASAEDARRSSGSARFNEILIESMRKRGGREIEYGVTVTGVSVDSEGLDDAEAYPVTVTAEREGKPVVYKAKYALGADGAHSAVRRSLGYKMVGDSSDAVWGVMDVFVQTDFPDIRKKSTLRSRAGNLLIIPREGGTMVRFYIELPHGTDPKTVRLSDLQESARQIFSQYRLDIVETHWWSAYSIGQRLADQVSKANRVFLMGDAFHTHSPKAGQGMNMSLQDGYNIGWKLAYVLKGFSNPEVLRTYNLEREKTAADLIAFDRKFMELFSIQKSGGTDGSTAELFRQFFITSGRYTAGLTTSYEQSMITSVSGSSPDSATKITVGMRFPSAQLVRYIDARAVQLSAEALIADGKWKVLILCGGIENLRTDKLAFLAKDPNILFGPGMAGVDLIEPVLVVHGDRTAIQDSNLPKSYAVARGRYAIIQFHHVYVDDKSYNNGHGQAYQTWGIDPRYGAAVVVRPDQYVALVCPVEEAPIREFFQGVWSKQAQ